MLSKLNRRLIWTAGILAGLTILFVVLITLLPAMTKWYATSWLEERGVSASIEDINIKMLDGQIRIKAFHAVGSEKHKIDLGEIFVQVHLRDLLENKVTIEKIEFSDFYVDAYQQLGKPIKVGGILFGEPDATEAADAKKQEESAAWEVLVKDVDFKNFKACIQLHNQQGKPLYNDCLTLGDFAWDGHSSYLLDTKENDKPGKLGAKLSFVLKNLRLYDNTDDSEVVNIGALHIKGLAIDGIDDIKIKSVKLDDYAVLQRAKKDAKRDTHVAKVEHITLTKLSINDLNKLLISDVNIDGLRTYLFRQKNGNFEPIDKVNQLLFPETALEKTRSEQPMSEDQVQPEQAATQVKPAFKVDRLTITGNSVVTVKDNGVTPRYAGAARDIKVQLKNIDSSNPAKLSQLDFSFIVGKHGKVNFGGDIALFAKRPTGKLKGTIRAVNAAEFSTYLNSTVQHRIKSGHVDADIELAVELGKLDSQFNFVFHKLYVEELSEEKSKQYKDKLGVPLSTALSLLREKDDSIHLKLPVTGDIENPDFSLNYTIQKVMADAIKSAVIKYYTPFGLVTVATVAFDLATALRFEPVLFEPTKTDINISEKQRLEKLVTLLNERPNIKLVVCGHASLDDRFKLFPVDEELEKQVRDIAPDDEENTVDINTLLPELSDKEVAKLNGIAKLRGENVRDHLAKEKEIDPSRMIMCNPKYENDQDKPRVALSL